MKKINFVVSVMSGYTATVPTAPLLPNVWKMGGTLETDAVLGLVIKSELPPQDVADSKRASHAGYNYITFDDAGATLHSSVTSSVPHGYRTLKEAVDAYNAAAY